MSLKGPPGPLLALPSPVGWVLALRGAVLGCVEGQKSNSSEGTRSLLRWGLLSFCQLRGKLTSILFSDSADIWVCHSSGNTVQTTHGLSGRPAQHCFPTLKQTCSLVEHRMKVLSCTAGPQATSKPETVAVRCLYHKDGHPNLGIENTESGRHSGLNPFIPDCGK